MIFVDSREKKWQHIKKYFDDNGIEYIVKKLDVGDYQSSDNLRVTIDRKQNLQEICKNLMNKKDKSRIYKEIRRAYDSKLKFYLLIEHGNGINSIQDVSKWADAYSGVDGRILINELYKLQVSYNVTILFCDKSETAKKIIEILSTYLNNQS